MTRLAFICFFALFLALSGCAVGDQVFEQDATHAPGDDPDMPTHVDPDMGPNPPADMPQADIDPSGCRTCCPEARTCSDETTLQVCTADGLNQVTTPCDDGEVCQDGECIRPATCVEGERRCQDSTTYIQCRPGGESFATFACGEDEVCIGGMCASGLPVSAACNAASDCATNRCRCEDGSTDNCPQVLSNYCTMTCEAETCGMDGGCLASSVARSGIASVDYDHCIRRCPSGDCGASHLRCVQAPLRAGEGITWANACMHDAIVDIGSECSSATTCLGDTCLNGYFNTSYCTRRCDHDGACPDNAACVELLPGQFYCSLLCGDGRITGSDPCPLDEPVDRFDVTCKILPRQGEGVARVCATP